MCLNRLFSIKELEELDQTQLAILDDAIRLEVRNSKEITRMLRQKLEPMYNRWVAKGRAQRSRGAKKAAKGKRK
jgi:hypothetical protein